MNRILFLNKFKKIYFIFLLCLNIFYSLILINAQQNQINFEHISIKDGLSNSIIKSIIQDNKGFLWIGTENGLNKFDGYKFTTYIHDPQDPNSLNSNEITVLFEDHLGLIWVGTEKGIHVFDRNLDRFLLYQDDNVDTSKLEILSIYQDDKNILWVGTDEGLYIYNRNNNIFIHYQNYFDITGSLYGEDITAVFQDSAGILVRDGSGT